MWEEVFSRDKGTCKFKTSCQRVLFISHMMVERFHTRGSETFASHECAYLFTDTSHMIRARLCRILRERYTKRNEVSSTF